MRPELYRHLAIARKHAETAMPYLSEILFRMVWQESDKLDTMGVSAQWIVQVNYDWAMKLTIPECAYVMLHECGHIVNNHGDRRIAKGVPDEHFSIWNVAGDLEWNQHLTEFTKSTWNNQPLIGIPGSKNGVQLLKEPEEGCFVQKMGFDAGLLAEQYYDLLMKKMKQGQKNGQGQPGGQGGTPMQIPGQKGTPGVNNGQCGSCATHTPKSEQEEKNGVTADEKAQMVKSAALKAAEHAAKYPGSVPGSLVRLADELSKPPKVRWEEKLRRAINGGQARAMGAVDYTFLRPSRRTRTDNIILPRLAAPKPSVSVVIDTSGSMGDDILGNLLNEVRSILMNAEKVFWIPTDTQAHGVHRVRSVAAARDKVFGGGGTDLTSGLVAAAEKHTPVTVVLTDGWNSWTQDKPQGLKDVIILRTDQRAEGGYPMPSWAYGIDVEFD